ncbi:hypothetical protein BC835DRAFT_1419003 [Cytidiella melzeri]|nr:hypothetical protein BC835DRAFT_1419003 [Cytidiella melzeri]
MITRHGGRQKTATKASRRSKQAAIEPAKELGRKSARTTTEPAESTGMIARKHQLDTMSSRNTSMSDIPHKRCHGDNVGNTTKHRPNVPPSAPIIDSDNDSNNERHHYESPVVKQHRRDSSPEMSSKDLDSDDKGAESEESMSTSLFTAQSQKSHAAQKLAAVLPVITSRHLETNKAAPSIHLEPIQHRGADVTTTPDILPPAHDVAAVPSAEPVAVISAPAPMDVDLEEPTVGRVMDGLTSP